MPPKFPWKTAALVICALVVIGVILVTMWPGLRKPHALKPETTGTRSGSAAAVPLVASAGWG